MTTPDRPKITYINRPRGGYYAFVEGVNATVTVQEVANHMRTTRYFKWSAKARYPGGRGYGTGSTRVAAVLDAVRVVPKGELDS